MFTRPRNRAIVAGPIPRTRQVRERAEGTVDGAALDNPLRDGGPNPRQRPQLVRVGPIGINPHAEHPQRRRRLAAAINATVGAHREAVTGVECRTARAAAGR